MVLRDLSKTGKHPDKWFNMVAGFKTGPIFYKVGTGSFLHCFFSNIAFHLENQQWGASYPLLMNKLYHTNLALKDIDSAVNELLNIQEKFKDIEPSEVIWNIEDLDKKPPWGNDIADHITSLATYFYTNDGDDLFGVLLKALDAARRINKNLSIVSL